MTILRALNHFAGGQARTKRRALLVFAVLLAGSIAPSMTRHAEAAFPGRNGLIALSLVQPPYTLSSHLVFPIASDRDIFTIGPNGERIQQVTIGTTDHDAAPSWSPDGRKIAFMRRDLLYGRVSASDIYIVNADGTGLENLTNTPTHFEFQPGWSPDGRTIVFSSDRAQPDVRGRVLGPAFITHDLFMMNADGSDVVQLTSEPGNESFPAWAPDGRWIAYEQDRQIALIRPDGTGRHVLASTNVSATVPSWSPDGTQIAFAGSCAPCSEMWVINVDGSGLRNLSPKSGYRTSFPTWSPDGKWIAFTSDRDGEHKLYKMRSDGSQVQKVMDIDLQSPDVLASFDWGPRS